MSTHCAVIEKLPDGTYRGIYSHFDGYLKQGVGENLMNYYKNPEKVHALISLGALDVLQPELKDCKLLERMGDFIVTGRSWGEVASKISHTGYVYVFANDKWYCNGLSIEKAMERENEDQIKEEDEEALID